MISLELESMYFVRVCSTANEHSPDPTILFLTYNESKTNKILNLTENFQLDIN